jgi:hypothetical protein
MDDFAEQQLRRAVEAVKRAMDAHTADTSPEQSRRIVETATDEFLNGPQCPCRTHVAPNLRTGQ